MRNGGGSHVCARAIRNVHIAERWMCVLMQTDKKAANGFIHHHPWLLTTVDRDSLASLPHIAPGSNSLCRVRLPERRDQPAVARLQLVVSHQQEARLLPQVLQRRCSVPHQCHQRRHPAS
jgi:hypothetical protein